MKCMKCGYEGSRAVFRYISPMEAGVRNSIRLCPSCGGITTCDEFDEDENAGQVEVWGLKALGRKTVKGVNKDGNM